MVEKVIGAALFAAGVVAPLAFCDVWLLPRFEKRPPLWAGWFEPDPKTLDMAGAGVDVGAGDCEDALSVGLAPKPKLVLPVVPEPPPPNKPEPPPNEPGCAVDDELPPKLKPLPPPPGVELPNSDGLLFSVPDVAGLPKRLVPVEAGVFPVLWPKRLLPVLLEGGAAPKSEGVEAPVDAGAPNVNFGGSAITMPV